MFKEKKYKTDKDADLVIKKDKVRFVIYGTQMIEKKVGSSGNCGRIFLPPYWVGNWVKIVRID